jgi:ABC-type methionine transport system permease subunit
MAHNNYMFVLVFNACKSQPNLMFLIGLLQLTKHVNHRKIGTSCRLLKI